MKPGEINLAMNSYELNLPGMQRTVQACGDADVLKRRKLALFCSQMCPGDLIVRAHDYAKNLCRQDLTIISGFHSSIEKECLTVLARGTSPLVYCPARSIDRMRLVEPWHSMVEKGRGLVLSPFAPGTHQMSAEYAAKRNRFITSLADEVLIVYASPDGKLMNLAQEVVTQKKLLWTFTSEYNEDLARLGARRIPEWKNREEREAFEVQNFIKCYEIATARKLEISQKGKPPEPDFFVADRQSGALMGVELTSVYSGDRSVPDVHMKLDNLKTIPYDPGEVERYLQQIINKAKAKADIYTRNHPGNMPLALSIYVNEYIAIHADEEEWLEVGKKVQKNLGPFQMAILWSLPDEGMVAVEKESVVYRKLS